MYYKIENKGCEVYKKLHEMRINELNIEGQNKQKITEKTGLEWDAYLGHSGQQNLRRVTQYIGFKFVEPERVNSKIWIQHPEYNDIYIPNRKTKLGKEMYKFLNHELNGGFYSDVFYNLGLEHPCGRFTFPFVQICGDVIILYLDESIDVENDNIIEITTKEAKILLTS